MNVLKSLFTRSPFSPLQSHMEKVGACVLKLEELYSAYISSDYERISQLAEEISELEHAADLTKNEIRNQLRKGLFLPVNRGDLLEILSLQDTIADHAEDIGILMSLKKLEPLKGMEGDLKAFLEKNIEAVKHVHQIIQQMDELLETSFGGKEAEKVRQMVDEVAYMEHQADQMQREILKKLYNMGDAFHYSSFILWIHILQTVASLANLSEKLANRVRMLLEVK